MSPLAKGADLSHWQGDATFSGVRKWADFIAIKATDGAGGVDPEFNDSDDHRWSTMGADIASGKLALRIAYSFLELGSGAAQADHLIKVAGFPGKGSRHCYDWEAAASSSSTVLTQAVERDHARTKIWPIVYCTSSNQARAKAAARFCPLWIADWTPPYPGGWTFLQYVGIGLDLDEFNGNRAALEAWAGTSGEEDDMPLTNDEEESLAFINGQKEAVLGRGKPKDGDSAFIGGNKGDFSGAAQAGWEDKKAEIAARKA